KKVESKWAMDSEDQFRKVKKWNNLTNKVRLQHFKQDMESGWLTLCKGCEISPAKTKTKHCFMERDISKLWAIQSASGRTNTWEAESNDKKYSANQITQKGQMYDENNLSNDKYMVLGPKYNNQHNSKEVTLVGKLIGTRQIQNKFLLGRGHEDNTKGSGNENRMPNGPNIKIYNMDDDIADQLRGYYGTQVPVRRTWMPLFFGSWILALLIPS
ncbi:6785_t:CDS:2, partial [Gigaspora rosea]